jgi:hypothetical protein
MWDAVQLAQELLRNGWQDISDVRGDHDGVNASYSVSGGELKNYSKAPRPLCVPRLNVAGNRSVGVCDEL